MHPETAKLEPLPEAPRRLVEYGADTPGPTLVAVGGIHGNEPSGVEAIERVKARLEHARPAFRGRFVGLAGNLPALAQRVRFIDEDLNRIFSPERVAALGTDPADEDARSPSSERRQQRELLHHLDELFDEAVGGVVFLDLHTSSAPGEPFVCIGDTLPNRRLALQLPVPAILGLEEQVDGALLEHVNNQGHITIGVEAGQHDAASSIDHHEAVLLLALVASGCLDERDLPDADALRTRLRAAADRLPPVLEVRYRHPVAPGDGFVMRPGYENFEPVHEGDLLGQDREGEIRAPESGRILLPLYQGLGSDGFFLVREVRPFWLRVSAGLRRLHLDRILHWLPGVERLGPASNAFAVDPGVARWYPVETFHLLGFRKERSRGERLIFARRVE